MKFFLKETISYDEIYSSVRSYIQDGDGRRPSYLLIHPETRHKIMIASHDVERGMQYRIIEQVITKDENHPIKSAEKIFGLYLIQSMDVEPDFMIVCG
jgi:hypothetical protein